MSASAWHRWVLAVLAIALFAAPLQAQEKRPIQLSLVAPLQIFPEEDTIAGFRLNVIYGSNVAVSGFDLGVANHTTTGAFKGVQFGILGLADTEFIGWQNNWVNITMERFEGFQSGVVNYSHGASGFLLAGVNVTSQMHGLQLAIVNYTERMHGIQVGLINIIKEGGAFPFFPIVNWSFEE
jgi:hypothetical protein